MGSIGTLDRLKNIFKGDRTIWFIFLFLCVISIIEVYSASSALGYKTGNYWKAATMHTFYLGLGIIAMLVTLNIQCRYFKLMVKIFYPLSIAMLVFVLLFGKSENDAARWIDLGLFNLQPSEVAKGALILTVANILSAMQTPDGTAPPTFKYVMWATFWVVVFIVPENLSTALILCIVVFFMMFLGRVRTDYLRNTALGVIAIGTIGVASVMMIGDASKTEKEEEAQAIEMQKARMIAASHKGIEGTVIPESYQEKKTVEEKSLWEKLTHRMDTWKRRIIDFATPVEGDPKKFDLDRNGQVGHANIAIALSEGKGVGPGQSVQRDFVAQAYSDFIFAIIIEETGVLGMLFVMALYIWLFVRTGQIAAECVNPFPALLIMGLAMLIVLQAFFNMCVAVGLLPVTGQPLPLISRGGTSSIITCIYIGVILSVSRTAEKRVKVKKQQK